MWPHFSSGLDRAARVDLGVETGRGTRRASVRSNRQGTEAPYMRHVECVSARDNFVSL